jgi:signal recognition particle subunit SRP54
MFETLTNSFKNIANKMRFVDNEVSLKKALIELKKSLLKEDVHFKATKEIINQVESYFKQNDIGQDNFKTALTNSINDTLKTPNYKEGFVYSKNPTTNILFAGLSGSGKTTSIAKLANYLKQKNKKVLLVACDLIRAGAIEQLKTLGEQIEVDVFYDDSKNAVAKNIAVDGAKKAKNEFYDVCLIDSAGRQAIDLELMGELKELKKSVVIDETFYVADALNGHKSSEVAKAFNNAIGIDGIILSKFDGDSKGGVALSLAYNCGISVRFLGIGEKIPDFEVFIASRITNRLMGLGDIEGLGEKVSSVVDEKKAREIKAKLKKGEFSFDDFLSQMDMMKKMGSMKNLIGMIPGLSGNIGSAIKDMDFENSDQMKNIKAMIGSMTPYERKTPSILNPSRKMRIAKGCGLSDMAINRILKQFKNTAKMAKKFSAKGGGVKDLNKMVDDMSGANMPASMKFR